MGVGAVYDFYAGAGAWASLRLGGGAADAKHVLAEAEAALESELREALPPRDVVEAAAAAASSVSNDAGDLIAVSASTLAPTVVLLLDGLCIAALSAEAVAAAAGDPRRAALPVQRAGLARSLLALSETGCEIVLAAPARPSTAAAATMAERLLPPLIDSDRYRFMAFQRAMRRALVAQYTAMHGGPPGAADAYADTWLATSPSELDQRYARAVLHVTAVLGREFTLPPSGAASAQERGAASLPRVLRLDLLPRSLGQVLVVDAAGGDTSRAFPRNALTMPPAGDASLLTVGRNDGAGYDDPLIAVADLVALFKLAGERAAAAGAPPPDIPTWLDRLAAGSGGTDSDEALAARSRAALSAATDLIAAAGARQAGASSAGAAH